MRGGSEVFLPVATSFDASGEYRDADGTIAIETSMYVVDYNIQQFQDRKFITDTKQEN